MRRDRIHIALAERGVEQFAILQTVYFTHKRNAAVRSLEENTFRLGGGLHGNGPALQIAQPINIAAAVDRNHLAADHIRFGPVVFILAPINGKASPDTVNITMFNQFLLFFPVNADEGYRIPQPSEGFLSQIHIYARRIAVFIGIIKRRIVVTAHLDRYRCFRLVLLHILGSRTSAQQHTRQRCRKYTENPSFESHGFPCFAFYPYYTILDL